MMRLLLVIMLVLFPLPSRAQPAPGPPAVGVVRAEKQQITQTNEFIGRIQSIGRVALVARVSAFLEKRLFVEGSEVKKGDLLYRLERAPFEAAVQHVDRSGPVVATELGESFLGRIDVAHDASLTASASVERRRI